MPLSAHFHHRLPQQPSSTNGPGDKLSTTVTSLQGTLPFLRPTHAHVHLDSQKLDWNSRDHRKGRHPLVQGHRRHISTILRLEWWNISWWVALVNPPTPSPCVFIGVLVCVWDLSIFMHDLRV